MPRLLPSLAIAVLLAFAAACGHHSAVKPSGVCASPRGWQLKNVCRSAVSYTRSKLGVADVRVLRVHIGGGVGDCAMAEVSTPLGPRRVLFAASGKTADDLWQPFAASKAFRWSQYHGDSDGLCGLSGAGLLAHKDLPETGWATA